MSSKMNKFIIIGILVGITLGIGSSAIWGPEYDSFYVRLKTAPQKPVKVNFVFNGSLVKVNPMSVRFDKENATRRQKVTINHLGTVGVAKAQTPVMLNLETLDKYYSQGKDKKLNLTIKKSGKVFVNVPRPKENNEVYEVVLEPVEPMARFGWLGELFINALKMLIVPLIIFSMVAGISSLGDIRRMGGVGKKTLLYYFSTTMIAVVIGIILVNIIQPGVLGGIDTSEFEVPDTIKGKAGQTIGSALEQIVLGLVWPNIVDAMVNLKIVPLIIFSLLLGGILTTLGEKGRPIINAFSTLNQATIKMVQILLLISPLGVFGLTAEKFGSVTGEGFLPELIKIGYYSLTVVGGLLIQAVIVLPLILKFLGKKNPWQYLKGMATALSTAFATASSSATLPVTLECVEKNNNVPNRAASFVLPLGATINMDGTALYEAVAAIFIAQLYGVDLTIAQQVLIFLTANLAAIGAAGIPSAGTVTMVMVLQAVNLPLEGMAAILTIDWFLDRWRTTVNVWGDAVGAAVLANQPEIKDTLTEDRQ